VQAGEGCGGKRPIRVLVADDHALYRRGLTMLLMQEEGIDVIGEAGDGHEAVGRAVELVPDVVLMDVRMPRSSGIEACHAVRRLVPSADIIMLTMTDEESELYEAIRAGAHGYLLKDVPGEEVAAGIESVHGGDALLSAGMAARLLEEFGSVAAALGGPAEGPVSAPLRLTSAEAQTLRLLARGERRDRVAAALAVPESTVGRHLRDVLAKLHAHAQLDPVEQSPPRG
jgi:DNA-binding NarL/FixJ family response regulator